MAGILDKKTRFIDLVVTQEGKRQLASGKLRAEFGSASDMHTFYQKGYTYSEVTDRLYFEAMERPENLIVLESDDSGKLLPFEYSATGSIVGNNIFEKENVITSDLHKMKISTGSQFSSLSTGLQKTFLNNFKSNYFLRSSNAINAKNFTLNQTDIKFNISNDVPFLDGPNNETINVNSADPLIFDSRIANLPNFRYLPPVNKDGTAYGDYEDLRNLNRQSLDDIYSDLGKKPFRLQRFKRNINLSKDKMGDLKVFYKKGKLDNPNRQSARLKDDNDERKQFKTIEFAETSEDNNLIIQVFEQSKNKFLKLDVIEAGVFYDKNDPNGNVEKNVYYAGKIFLDDQNNPKFFNIFTIIFD